MLIMIFHLITVLPAAAFFALRDVGAAPAGVTKQGTNAKVTPATAKSQAPKVEEKPMPAYTYKPGKRRDPFRPLIVKAEQKVRAKDRPPLERYNINEFKLTAIMWGGFGYNAMVEGPDGKGYFIRVGTIIGPNRGRVKKITKSRLIVEETYKTYTGRTERKRIVVELKTK